MKQLIDKSDLIAEIEKRLEAIANASPEDNKQFAAIRGAQHYELISLVRFINTLETKEVDLEKEIEEHVVGMPMSEFTHDGEVEDYWDWAREEFRYFFELGLKQKNL